MNPHKKQTLERQIIDQSGSETLDLNDFVLGYDGARIVGALIPQYHKNLRHIRLNGNNIDSEGFQFIFTALLNCPHLKSIEAEWNSIGSSDAGLISLCSLVNNLQYLEFIDLKNNRIAHHHAKFISQIIELNKKSLKVIDLRWNELGELGAKELLRVIPFNKNIKFIGLQDNRISTGTLMEIESILKSGTFEEGRVLRHSYSQPNTFTNDFFPISGDQYASMDVQLKTGQIRSKIDTEQKQATRYVEKIEIEIQKVLQKIKVKGAQIAQTQLKYDGILLQNQKLTAQLREAQRMLALEKERALGIQSKFGSQKSQLRNEKYKLNSSIQSVMEKFTQRNQRELNQIELVMGQKLDRLNAFYKERLHEKRVSRQKLAELKEDIMKFKLSKEDLTNKSINSQSISANRASWDEDIFVIQEEIAKAKTTLQNQMKKGQYMSKQLNNQIIKALNKQQNLEKQIFDVQNRIKAIHHGMALKNLELEKNLAELRLKESEIFDKEAAIEMETRYLKYMQSQSNVKIQVQSMVQEQINRGNQTSEEGIQLRIADVERALRAQQAQNRLIKTQYEKLMSQLENVIKKNIQITLFQ